MTFSYHGVLPVEVVQWGRYLYRKYHRYCDSNDDYWQTVALVWYRCKAKIDPSQKPYNYFVRSLARELWRLGSQRLRLPVSLPECAPEVVSERILCSDYPDSLKELVTDFSVVRKDLEEMSYGVASTANSTPVEH